MTPFYTHYLCCLNCGPSSYCLIRINLLCWLLPEFFLDKLLHPRYARGATYKDDFIQILLT